MKKILTKDIIAHSKENGLTYNQSAKILVKESQKAKVEPKSTKISTNQEDN